MVIEAAYDGTGAIMHCICLRRSGKSLQRAYCVGDLLMPLQRSSDSSVSANGGPLLCASGRCVQYFRRKPMAPGGQDTYCAACRRSWMPCLG